MMGEEDPGVVQCCKVHVCLHALYNYKFQPSPQTISNVNDYLIIVIYYKEFFCWVVDNGWSYLQFICLCPQSYHIRVVNEADQPRPSL